MEWEQRHQDRYGCDSWNRAAMHARIFFDWEMEHDRGIDSQERIRLVHARSDAEREWADHKRLTALVLWRAAYDNGLLVDDVELHTVRRYYNTALSGRLLADGPIPDAARTTLDRLTPEALHQVAVILDSHALTDSTKLHHVGPRTTVGYRVRELRSTPGWIEGDWTEDVRTARAYRKQAWQKRDDGSWQVTPADLRAAAQTSPAEPAYDYPAVLPGPDGYRLWLQDAHHLVAVGATLTTVADTLPRTADGYIGPLAMVLSGHGAVCRNLRESAEEIERLWAAEPVQPTDLSYWDLSHVPRSLREQTQEAKVLVDELRVWLENLAF